MADTINPDAFKLPNAISQPVDISHVLHELNIIDEHLNQAAIKDPNKRFIVRSSDKLTDLLTANDIDLNDKSKRTMLINILVELKKSAPTVNASFGTEASDQFIEKITQWFRQQIHPHCLVVVGFDPSIGVGSVVRTNNKVYDFSLRSQLKQTRGLLEERIKQLNVEGVK